ncbi:hypothetical protein R4Z09_23535 [Niallia oryzisoli]|uniref:Uncharacterized protein n=1 Tax=Niallia oryzisoli TaxID=1737571 RepID=A0ABZ2CDX4_9BACI
MMDYHQYQQFYPTVDSRQQQGQFFPGGGFSQRLNSLERRVDRLERQNERIERRLDRIERRLGIRQDEQYY